MQENRANIEEIAVVFFMVSDGGGEAKVQSRAWFNCDRRCVLLVGKGNTIDGAIHSHHRAQPHIIHPVKTKLSFGDYYFPIPIPPRNPCMNSRKPILTGGVLRTISAYQPTIVKTKDSFAKSSLETLSNSCVRGICFRDVSLLVKRQRLSSWSRRQLSQPTRTLEQQ